LSTLALAAGAVPVPLSPVEPPVLSAAMSAELCGPVPPVLLLAFKALALADGVALLALPLLPVELPELAIAKANRGRAPLLVPPVGLD
jgi:hypothetical protein